VEWSVIPLFCFFLQMKLKMGLPDWVSGPPVEKLPLSTTSVISEQVLIYVTATPHATETNTDNSKLCF